MSVKSMFFPPGVVYLFIYLFIVGTGGDKSQTLSIYNKKGKYGIWKPE